MAQKILVVLSDTYKTDRDETKISFIENALSEVFLDNGYDVDFESISAFHDDYDFDVNLSQMMKDVDDESAEICMDDYICVVTEGFSSWLWLLASYKMPLVCINPSMQPTEEYGDYMSDDVITQFNQLFNDRQQNIDQSICILTSDVQADDFSEYFKNNNIVQSEYSIDDEELWKDEVIKAVKFIEQNWSE